MVELADDKQLKYLAAIAAWRNSAQHSLCDSQKLYGKLMHASHLCREERTYLTKFECMFPTLSDKPFMPRTFPRAILDDLHWWSCLLSSILPFEPQFLAFLMSPPYLHTLMQAQLAASRLSSERNGKPGRWFLGGMPRQAETLDGWRRSSSSC